MVGTANVYYETIVILLPLSYIDGRICPTSSALPLQDGRPNTCRFLSRYNLPMKSQPVSDQESRRTWARLIAQVYEVDLSIYTRCSAQMRVLAVITEPEEVRKILRHLVKIGRSPPGLGVVGGQPIAVC